ncbi:DUF309 domain-containing protein [Peribacillus saganii]|uniref:DUF309 domain-containing protein n=1 Tax=Peribacillus saganii TaxID=2303992 RepID=A0A372LMI3_9BACI|nr:DUF309 domain-containing protein [Peribacillus saganii]RFU67789.1 DUF309 domain-containing protein [Peribacillus saganii]
MSYPEEFMLYLVHFQGSRDYFECHEILEEYWKEIDPGVRDSHWVGLIQLAVSQYHHRRNNFGGALRTIEKSIIILSNKKLEMLSLGIDYTELMKVLRESRENIKKQLTYRSIDIPISDSLLASKCKFLCEQNGFIWSSPSNMADYSLVNRHTVRDRTDVIKERTRQKMLRQNKG